LYPDRMKSMIFSPVWASNYKHAREWMHEF
jgi:hypothetical protein